MILYAVSDQRPSARRERISVDYLPTGESGFVIITEVLGQPNNYDNIYCKLSLVDMSRNQARLNRDLWADSKECYGKGSVVSCMIKMIYDSMS